MKILIDIGHPAHVHYFRNFIKIMEKKGYEFLIIARDRNCIIDLLRYYNVPFISRGKGRKSVIGKLIYALKAYFIIFKSSIKFKPDMFISQGGVYTAPIAFVNRKPHISTEDTENAIISHSISKLFQSLFLMPSCFAKKINANTINYNGYQELFYLHPNYFTPSVSVLNMIGVKPREKYIIMRFVSWDAYHDVGHSGLTLETKRKIVKELSKYAKVLISSEGELPEDLKKYQIKIQPEKIHDVLAFAILFIGEGATMASECACLGTPAIYINSLEVGYCKEEEEKYGLVFGFRNSNGVLKKALELLNTPNRNQEWQKKQTKMLNQKIDVTAFMVWFVGNYPDSEKIMKENPEYQFRYK